MKKLSFISFIFLACSFSAYSFSTDTEKKINLTMRQIGNSVLWSIGDSTSRINPITRKKDTYTISFEKPSPIDYDSIISISARELSRIDINDFVVEIKGCNMGEVYLSFAISPNLDTIAPCRGRDIANMCYEIDITLSEKKANYKAGIIPMLMLLLLSLAFVVHSKQQNKVIRHVVDTNKINHEEENVRIGNYLYNKLQSLLIFDEDEIPLSDKESKLLSVLYEQANHPVSRELLMHEIWGANGVVVLYRNIDVLVSKLRKKLASDPNLKITNVHGIGYKLEWN
jgi:DNA-binding winged helix-turn-helix (wHTH) protein